MHELRIKTTTTMEEANGVVVYRVHDREDGRVLFSGIEETEDAVKVLVIRQLGMLGQAMGGETRVQPSRPSDPPPTREQSIEVAAAQVRALNLSPHEVGEFLQRAWLAKGDA